MLSIKTEVMTFKDYIIHSLHKKHDGIDETTIPTVWSKKIKNVKPEEEEDSRYEDQEEKPTDDELEMDDDLGMEDEIGPEELDTEEPEDPGRNWR